MKLEIPVLVFGFFTAALSAVSGQVPAPAFSLVGGVYTNETLTVTLSLSNAPPGTTIRYIVNAFPTTDLPTTNSLVYTGALSFSENSWIKARAFPPAENLSPSPVVSQNYIFLDNTDKDFNSNLPLVIISTRYSRPDDIREPIERVEGTLTIIDGGNGRSSLHSTPQFQGQASFDRSGFFTKQELRFQLHDANGEKLAAPLLDLPADAEWFLEAPFSEKTLLNTFLMLELHEKMGHYAARRRFVEVFLDRSGGKLVYPQDYVGVYLLMETVEAGTNRSNIQPLSPPQNSESNLPGGYIFKKDLDSSGDLTLSTSGGAGFPPQELRLVYPEPDSLRVSPLLWSTWPGAGHTALGSNVLTFLLGYLNRMESALYASNWIAPEILGTTNHYSSYLDVDSFVDFHWVTEFAKSINGYRMGNYMHKDRGGKVKAEPLWPAGNEGRWTMSFGNADFFRGGGTDNWYFAESDQGMTAREHIWLRRLINGSPNLGAANALSPGGDPDFCQKIADRWSVLRTNVLNGSNVLRRIDELSIKLNEAAQRDLWGKYRASVVGMYVWPNPDGAMNGGGNPYYNGSTLAYRPWDVDYVNPTNYLGDEANSIIGQMKKWVLGRYLWIDNQFTPAPALSAASGQVTNGFVVTVAPPPGATLYYTLDGTDPRAPGGGVAPNALSNDSPVSLTIASSVRLFARAKAPTNLWYNTWSGPSAISLFTSIPSLRISEIMYHPLPPPSGTPYTAEDFEYLEVRNIGSTSLNLNRFALSGDAQFQFPNIVLEPGAAGVIVANIAAFQSRYGMANIILGAYTGHLGDLSGRLVLSGSRQEPILDFAYQHDWYPATDGLGFSLVIVDEMAPTSAWNAAGNWRPSSASNGSPGQTDPSPPPRPAVVVNEVLSRHDQSNGRAIELKNTADNPVDVSGWFLTDDLSSPKKYLIPPAVPIAAGGLLVLYETNSFGANGTNTFHLSANGGQVYLCSADGVDLTGYAEGFRFGAAPDRVTFGRYRISTGAEHFVAQRAETLGIANAGPLVGPIVISEINCHPPEVAINGIGFDNNMDQYLELQNIASTDAPLYAPESPASTWRLRNAIDYEFPTGIVIPAGGFLLVVGFDPGADPETTAGFRSRNGIPENVPLYGPWRNSLDYAGGSLELARPDLPNTNDVPYILVDRVEYSTRSPWPSGADGFGVSLQRVAPESYGNDPANWVAAMPSPGANFVPGDAPPALTSQPSNQLAPSGRDLTLAVTATGTAPLHYQWRFNNLNLDRANSSILTLTNLQFSHAGVYNVVIYNRGGSVTGTNFTLTVRLGLQITSQPLDHIATNGATTNFVVRALGTGTVRYQWRFNGSNLLNATNGTLTLSNTTTTNEGTYDCFVNDDLESTNSQPATLRIVSRAVFTQQPLSQTGVAGGSVTLTVSASGTAPIDFRWRKGRYLTNGYFNGFIVRTSNYSFLTLTNLSASDAALFDVIVTNIGGYCVGGKSPGISSNAVLTVLADSDRDGLPDDYQSVHPGVVGSGDEDHDGMSNAAEYFAGTDLFDPASKLKAFLTGTEGAAVKFNAVSNHSYTVQYTDGLEPASWKKLADLLGRAATRTETVFDPNSRPNRFYRIVTPIQP